MKFTELGVNAALSNALEAMGIMEPMAIQTKVLPKIIDGMSLVGQAPTGTGKTLAYLLPALQKINPEIRQAQVVILAPTYELCMQIGENAKSLIAKSGMAVRFQALIGGANIARQIDKLKDKPQLIVGSAGRILELVRKGKLKLHQVNTLVLDEFDRMLDDQNLKNSVDLVKELPKENMQYLLFSATASKKAMERAGFLNISEIVRVEESPAEQANRDNYYLITPFREKADTVRKLVRRLAVKRGLVFINKTFDAERILEKLRYEGIKAESLLGSADKMKRKNAIADFKKGKIQLLLSTDLAARGLDIPAVDYVFNLDLPENAQVYQHRAGRTARAGAKGSVVTLADIKEAYKLEKLEKSLKLSFKSLQKGEAPAKTATSPAKKKSRKPYKPYNKKSK